MEEPGSRRDQLLYSFVKGLASAKPFFVPSTIINSFNKFFQKRKTFMRKQVVLVTGVNGEIGHSLVAHLSESDSCDVIGLDVMPIDESIQKYLFKIYSR